jgi:competence protein ComEC
MHTTELYRIARRKMQELFEDEQERWGLWLPVFFAGGIGIYFSLPTEPLFFLSLVYVPATAFLVWDNRFSAARRWIFLGLFMLAAGFFTAQLRTFTVSTPTLKTRTKKVALTGVVDHVTALPDSRYRIILDSVKIEGYEPFATPAKVRLSLAKGTAPPDMGDVIRAQALLSPPSPPLVPGGYDAARALYFEGIGGVGYTRSPLEILRDGIPDTFGQKLKILRRDIGRHIARALPSETGEIAKALVTGEAKAVPRYIADNYRDAGIAHLLSVSGLHMSLIAGFIFAAVRFTLALLPAVSLRFNTRKIAAAAALAATFAYMLISGANLPAQRAFIMIAIALGAVLLNRQALSVVSIAWAAFIVLLLQPEALVSASFQLSFAAVLALVSAYEAGIDRYRRELAQKEGFSFFLLSCLAGILITDIIASTATAPYALYHFNRYAVYSLLGNLASTTVAGFLVMPALLAGTLLIPVGGSALFFKAAGYGIAFINGTAAAVARLPHAVLSSPEMPIGGLVAATLGGLWICLWKGRIRFWGFLPFFIGLLSPLSSEPPDFLVAGSGSMAAFKTAEGSLVLPPGRSDRLTREVWLSRFGQKENNPHAETYFKGAGYDVPPVRFKCESGFCLYEKDGFKTGYAKTKKGTLRACGEKGLDLLFLGGKYKEDCLSARRIVTQTMLYRNGAYTLRITDGRPEIQSISDVNGFRPWTPAFPTLSLKQAVMYFFTGSRYPKIRARIIRDAEDI